MESTFLRSASQRARWSGSKLFGGVLALCVGIAGAGELVLQVDESATTSVLPTVAAGRIDVAVHQNQSDLSSQVHALHTRDWITAARAIDTGGNWVVTFWLAHPKDGVALETEPGKLTFTPVPGAAPVAPELPAAESLSSILAGKARSVRCEAVPLPLPLLPPDAEAALLTSPLPRPETPLWTDAEPTVVGWSEIEGTRALLAQGEGDPARLLYRLGALHRDLGHAREAAWYFGKVAAKDRSAGAIAYLQAASAFLTVGEWERAEGAAKLAADAGAPPEHVLHVLGAISAHRFPGQGGALGRSLAATSPNPEALLLAGQLLLEAGCGTESLAVLHRALPYLNRRDAAVATLWAADSHMLLGDLDAAARTYAEVSARRLDPERAAILRGRTRILAIEQASAATWAGPLAELARDASENNPASAAALFALAQAYDILGENGESVQTYATLSRRFPSLVASVAGKQHWSALERRFDQLLDAGRDMDALALHRSGWDDGLIPHVDDPAALARIANAYGETEFPDAALATWRTVADIERVHKLDSRETVLAIANLYVEAGAFADALDSVAWLKRHPLPSARRGEVALLEGRAHVGLRDVAKARSSFGTALASASTQPAAAARIALLDADNGACPVAIEPLTTALAAPPAGVDPTSLSDALVRCHLAAGNPEAAAVPALVAAGATTDDGTRALRTWQASRLSPDAAGGKLAEAAATSPGVWGQLAREEQAQREFAVRMKQ